MEDEELKERKTAVEHLLLKIKKDIKRTAGSKEEISSAKATALTKMSNIKLPRFEIPTFDVDILNWHFSGNSLIVPYTAGHTSLTAIS